MFKLDSLEVVVVVVSVIVVFVDWLLELDELTWALAMFVVVSLA